MEILFVSHKYPPSTGGMERQSYELINGMKRYASVHHIVYEGNESQIGFFLKLYGRIRRVCSENPGISVIHFNDGLMATACLWLKIPKIIKRAATIHGLDIVFPNVIYQKYLLPRLNARLDTVIAVSEATAKACINRNIQAGKVKVIRNGVDKDIAASGDDHTDWLTARFNTNPEKTRVLVAMGRAVERKGFSWFIKNVIPGLKGDFRLFVVGPFNKKKSWLTSAMKYMPAIARSQIALFLGYPSDEVTIKALLERADMKEKVVHTGKLPFDDIKKLLACSTAFVMPNIEIRGDMEGFGLVCLEASLCGALVIASESGGIPDAVHPGKNGMLLPPGDTKSWTGHLNDVLENPSAYDLLKARGKDYTLAHFSWDKMVREYRDHFEGLSEKT